MTKVTSLALQRMRRPLLVLIGAYAVSILGMVLVPGVDDQGQPWHMDFFHALYFVSFMSTTIGFGEIPYAFSEAQRLWTTVIIYFSVTTWVYAFGSILALVQEPAFRAALTSGRYARSVRRIREPFYLVCGYGDTGSLLVHALAERRLRAVVIDIDPQRIQDLVLDEPEIFVPGLCADAADPQTLLVSGLKHPHCAAVVAVTNNDQANLTVAITVKLLNPALPVICRAESAEVEANMASFGTDHIIDPFEAFAERVAMAIHSPGLHLLHEWLSGVPDSPLTEPLYPPRGSWVLCGYGRFGKAMHRYLGYEGVPVVVVEADPTATHSPPGAVVGRGTGADTLREAGIDKAVGLVAGTNDDADNLSIIMTALALNPRLFVVARQNKRAHEALFGAARSELVMQSGRIIARKILTFLITPLLARFLRLSYSQRGDWANLLVSRIAAVVGDRVPDIWVVNLNTVEAPALYAALAMGEQMCLGNLLRDPWERERPLPCIPLLLRRREQDILLPEPDTGLALGDVLLFCGDTPAGNRMRSTLRVPKVLTYLSTGREIPDGMLWRWLAGRGG